MNRSRGNRYRGSSRKFTRPSTYSYRQPFYNHGFINPPFHIENVQERIIEILRNVYPRQISSYDIFQSLHFFCSEKDINFALHNLSKRRLVKEIFGNPSEWLLLPFQQEHSVHRKSFEKHRIESNLYRQKVSPSTSYVSKVANNRDIRTIQNEEMVSSTNTEPHQESSQSEDVDFSDLPVLTDGKNIFHSSHNQSNNSSTRVSDADSENFSTSRSSPGSCESISGYDENMVVELPNPNIRKDATTVIRMKLLSFLYKLKQARLSEFVTEFRDIYKKKQINQCLYTLQKDQLIKKVEDTPPLWVIEAKGEEYYNSNLKSCNSDCSSLRKRQIPTDYIQQLESVSISQGDSDIDKAKQSVEPPRKIRRMACAAGKLLSSDKNPISQLMEFVQANNLKIDFQMSEYGPDHKKKFQVTITLDSQTYPPVEGSSKKDAKTKACESVMSFLQQSELAHSKPVPSIENKIPSTSHAKPLAITLGNSTKNAVSHINEYAQANSLSIDFQTESYGPDHKKSFRTTLTLGTRAFRPVSASSKKESKLKAAEAALVILQNSGKIKVSSMDYNEEGARQELNTFHDRVALLVNSKFHSLLAELPDTVVGRKIVAGFVMSRTVSELGDETTWQVVSIGSGNRCVAGDKLSMQGGTVNDCHAEVIARRGFMRFLYDQILSYTSDEDEDCILKKCQGDEMKFELKPGISFHLYISTAPCGDSALFAKSDLTCNSNVAMGTNQDKHHPLFDNKKQGILRTKVENGEGCIPIDEDANVPTWDGLLRGERLRTMSCSDKLAKWNFLGLQGALLCHFLPPIYMSSLTLGMLFHHGHLTRAVCCRLEKYVNMLDSTNIPQQFRFNHPLVAKVSGEESNRDTGKVKTREYSLNWSAGDERAEVLDGTVGRCEMRYGCQNLVSQVSKSSLYSLFEKISKVTYPTYNKAKEAAIDYQKVSAIMKEAFEKANCGKWMSKPVEVEDF